MSSDFPGQLMELQMTSYFYIWIISLSLIFMNLPFWIIVMGWKVQGFLGHFSSSFDFWGNKLTSPMQSFPSLAHHRMLGSKLWKRVLTALLVYYELKSAFVIKTLLSHRSGSSREILGDYVEKHMLVHHFSHYSSRRCRRMVLEAAVWSTPHAPITPNFPSDTSVVKLLGIMIKNRC